MLRDTTPEHETRHLVAESAARILVSGSDASGRVLVPDTELMLSARYAKVGADLVLTGPKAGRAKRHEWPEPGPIRCKIRACAEAEMLYPIWGIAIFQLWPPDVACNSV